MSSREWVQFARAVLVSWALENVKQSHFYHVIEIGNICFMLERKPFSGSQKSEVFTDA